MRERRGIERQRDELGRTFRQPALVLKPARVERRSRPDCTRGRIGRGCRSASLAGSPARQQEDQSTGGDGFHCEGSGWARTNF